MIRIEIRCSRCGTVGAATEGLKRKKIHQMRTELQRKGWWPSARHGNDWCPDCIVVRGRKMRVKRQDE